jgi:alpha-beta hydrolase superfamily lysophospholipase
MTLSLTGVVLDLLIRGLLIAAALLLALLALRIVLTRGAAALEPWHLFVPDEPAVEAIEQADWAHYLAAEDRLMAAVEDEVSGRLAPADQVPINRYFKGSPVHPEGLRRNWNRSFVLEPDGPLRGAAVLLHGLTDSPYSLRHIAMAYRSRGFVAIAIRLPGHGTTPAALSRIGWHHWAAATRLAIREARRRIGRALPLHLVGYSNGGTLALDHALACLDDASLERPDQLVLLSPMVGITAAARFAGIAGWPAIVPRWARTAWIKIVPEYNPFKYNSLPVNAARQSYRVTRDLQRRLARHMKDGRLAELPPVLTFQSVVDATVLTDAVIHGLHARLAPQRSDLVLFDVNRATRFGHLIRPMAARDAWSLLPPAPRPFAVTVVTNRDAGSTQAVATSAAAGSLDTVRRPLDLAFPRDVYSLSHIALPFPLHDSLYGLEPDLPDEFGISLGAMATRGERNVLAVPGDELTRATCNPFFAYLVERILATLPDGAPLAGPPAEPAPASECRGALG